MVMCFTRDHSGPSPSPCLEGQTPSRSPASIVYGHGKNDCLVLLELHQSVTDDVSPTILNPTFLCLNNGGLKPAAPGTRHRTLLCLEGDCCKLVPHCAGKCNSMAMHGMHGMMGSIASSPDLMNLLPRRCQKDRTLCDRATMDLSDEKPPAKDYAHIMFVTTLKNRTIACIKYLMQAQKTWAGKTLHLQLSACVFHYLNY